MHQADYPYVEFHDQERDESLERVAFVKVGVNQCREDAYEEENDDELDCR